MCQNNPERTHPRTKQQPNMNMGFPVWSKQIVNRCLGYNSPPPHISKIEKRTPEQRPFCEQILSEKGHSHTRASSIFADLAPRYFCLFPKVKGALKGTKFRTVLSIMDETDSALCEQWKEYVEGEKVSCNFLCKNHIFFKETCLYNCNASCILEVVTLRKSTIKFWNIIE